MDSSLNPFSNPSSSSDSPPPPSTIEATDFASVQVVSPPLPFAPCLGAWKKPLHFTPPATPPEPASPISQINLKLPTWPSLKEGLRKGQRKRITQEPNTTMPNLPVSKLPPPILKEDGSFRFPWAARMNPTSRNLFRAAEPTYRIDGTPQVTIPSKVLLLGPENQDEYVVGNFYRCSLPPGGLVHAVVNRLWGRSCKVFSRKLGETAYLFHIPHEPTRSWVLQRGLWHIDDCLLFVAPWSPAETFSTPEISTIPVWVNLKKIPDRLYSRLGISHIASGLGEPMLTHKPRLDPTLMGEAKIMVEVELDKPFPQTIALDDKRGNIFLVEVEYTWIPSVCERCGHLGHKEKRCLLPAKSIAPEALQKTVPLSTNDSVPVVNVNKFFQQPKNQDHSSFIDVTESVAVQHSHQEESLKSQAFQDIVVTHQQDSQSFDSNFEREQEEQAANSTLSHVAITNTTNLTTSIDYQVLPSSPAPISKDLATTLVAPLPTHIMESIPSTTKIIEDNHSVDGSPKTDFIFNTPHKVTRVSPSETDYGDEVELEDETMPIDSHLKTTRGGRPIRPSQKMQDMEWTTVVGKGNRGRRGRGGHNLQV